jgi:hypothetical protein
MYIGTGIHISQRQLKGWAGRQNRFKIIDFSSVSCSRQDPNVGLKKNSLIAPFFDRASCELNNFFNFCWLTNVDARNVAGSPAPIVAFHIFHEAHQFANSTSSGSSGVFRVGTVGFAQNKDTVRF